MKVECGNPNCSNTMHPVKLKLGIAGSGEKWNDLWFCSHKCYFDVRADLFIEAKRDGLKKLVRRVKLGLLLLKKNLIDKETLSMALEEQTRSRKRLGELLVEKEKITTRELKAVLALQAGVAPVSLDHGLVVKLKRDIPFKLIREFRFVCFKFDRVERTISVALYDIEMLPSLEEIFSEVYPGYLVKFYLDDKQNILDILTQNYPEEKFPSRPVAVSFEDKQVEVLVYKIVDFLHHNNSGDIKIDQLPETDIIRITSKVDDLFLDIEVSTPPEDET